MGRAVLFELTRYSKPWHEGLLEYDGVIQRAGSQGGKDNKWDEFHPNVMRFPVRGAYWYFGSAVSWKTQADLFLSIVGDDYRFLACDFEETGNVLSKSFVAAAMEFCKYLTDRGHKVVIYTNQSIYQDYINKYDPIRAKLYDFWLAWPATPAARAVINDYQPPTPPSRPDWKIWQWAFGEHEIDGLEKDVFNGDKDDLYKWAGVETFPPEPPPATPYITYITAHYSDGSEKNWTP